MSMRKFCIIFDLVMAFIFFLIGIWFYKSNGKASNFLTGYNMKSAEERKKYDEKKMCKDYGKRMMLWPIPFVIGAVIDYAFPMKGLLIAWIIWAVMLILLLIEICKPFQLLLQINSFPCYYFIRLHFLPNASQQFSKSLKAMSTSE